MKNRFILGIMAVMLFVSPFARAVVDPKLGSYHLTGILTLTDGITSLIVNPRSRSAYRIELNNRSKIQKLAGKQTFMEFVDADIIIKRKLGTGVALGSLSTFSPSKEKMAPIYDSLLKRIPATEL